MHTTPYRTIFWISALVLSVIIVLVLEQKDTPPLAPDKDLLSYYTEAQSLRQDIERSVTFLAVGDISLSRNVAAVIKKKNDPLYPFRKVEALLRSTDFNFGNLATPFSRSDAITAQTTLVFNAPKANVAGLTAYNFTVLTLANNHAYDQGLEGVLTTRNLLADNNILTTGTGSTLDEAWTPAVHTARGMSVGFIGASYASVNDGGKATNQYVARIEDLQKLQSAIKNLQPKVDFIVATMHAGTEYTATPNPDQIAFAHAAIDAGADMVIGHHPHWVQEKEWYCTGKPSTRLLPKPPTTFETTRTAGCGWIYYSLGNFIFDQSWSEQTKTGLALKSTLRSHTIHTPNTVLQNAGTPTSEAPFTIGIEEVPIRIVENCCAQVQSDSFDTN